MRLVCKEGGVAQSYAEAGNDGCDNCHVIWVICGTSCNYCGNAGGIVCPEINVPINNNIKNIYNIIFIFSTNPNPHTQRRPPLLLQQLQQPQQLQQLQV